MSDAHKILFETHVWCIDQQLQELIGKTENEFRPSTFNWGKVTCIRRRSREDSDPDIIEDGITILYTVDHESFIISHKYEEALELWKNYLDTHY